MIGLVDTDGFRDAVLEQRDYLQDAKPSRSQDSTPASPAASDELTAIARDIRDALARIETKLDKPG
jgi:hypothetical protein